MAKKQPPKSPTRNRTGKTSKISPNPPDKNEQIRQAKVEKLEGYFENRARRRVLTTDDEARAAIAEQKRAFIDARSRISKEIKGFYDEFSRHAKLTPEKAKIVLTPRQRVSFQKTIEKRVREIDKLLEKDSRNEFLRQYRTQFQDLSLVKRVTRQEALQSQIKAEIVQLGAKQEDVLKRRGKRVVNLNLALSQEDAQKISPPGVELGIGSADQVVTAAAYKWEHADFSSRIWKDKEMLMQDVKRTMSNALVNHAGADVMAREMATRMNISQSNALRLIRTEFHFLANQATLDRYKTDGIKEYQLHAENDDRTCNKCRDLDGQTFSIAEKVVGVNYPPLHPNCRCTTRPVIDWDDDEKWDFSDIELDDAELEDIGVSREEYDDIMAQDASANGAITPELTKSEQDDALDARKTLDEQREKEEAQKQLAESIANERRAIAENSREILTSLGVESKKYEELESRRFANPVDNPRPPITELSYLADVLAKSRTDILLLEQRVSELQKQASTLDDAVAKPDKIDIVAPTDDSPLDVSDLTEKQLADALLQRIPASFQTSPLGEFPASTAAGRDWESATKHLNAAKECYNAARGHLITALEDASWHGAVDDIIDNLKSGVRGEKPTGNYDPLTQNAQWFQETVIKGLDYRNPGLRDKILERFEANSRRVYGSYGLTHNEVLKIATAQVVSESARAQLDAASAGPNADPVDKRESNQYIPYVTLAQREKEETLYHNLILTHSGGDYQATTAKYTEYLEALGADASVIDKLTAAYSPKLACNVPPPAMHFTSAFRQYKKSGEIHDYGAVHFGEGPLIILHRDPSHWSGRSETALHEFGHYVDRAYLRGAEFWNSKVTTELSKAFKKAKMRIKKHGFWLDCGGPAKKKFGLYEGYDGCDVGIRSEYSYYELLTSYIQHKIPGIDYERTKKLHSMISDSFQSVFGEHFGSGHSLKYAKDMKNTYIEATAQCFATRNLEYDLLADIYPEVRAILDKLL